MSDDSVDIPVACSLTEAELEVRGDENAGLFAHARVVEELPDGYRFAFPADDDGIPALVRFILAERACCPFFTFALTFATPHDAIWLTLQGSEGVKDSLFGRLLSIGGKHGASQGVGRSGNMG